MYVYRMCVVVLFVGYLLNVGCFNIDTALFFVFFYVFFFFQAEDGIRDLVRSRGLGDVYKRQAPGRADLPGCASHARRLDRIFLGPYPGSLLPGYPCLLYTSDAADERSSVDLGGRRIIKKKNRRHI